MKNTSIKIKICEETEGFAIAPETLNQVSDGSWNYMQPFKIATKKIVCHGKVSEAGDDQARGTFLLVGEKRANELGLEDGQKVTIEQSRQEPIRRIQLKVIKKSKKTGASPLPYVEGIQPEVGHVMRYEGENHVVKSIDPIEGYIDESTTIEILGEDGKVFIQESNPIKRKSSASKVKGFSAIIGMEDEIEEIKEKIIGPMRNPSWAVKYLNTFVKGAIFNGPPGIGKTALVRAVKEELGIPFYSIPNSVATSHLGAITIQNTYQEAAGNTEGAIVFIDEIDLVAPRDLILNHYGAANATALQEAMDGLEQNPKVVTFAATNNLHNVAEALLRPGRFDIIIQMKLPVEKARGKLFAHFLSARQTESDIDYADLSDRSASFSGADIECVCKNAGTKALSKHCKSGKNQYISQKDLVNEIHLLNPTGARLLGVERPKFTFDDMYGADSMKKVLKRKLDLLSGKIKSSYNVADSAFILLHGPPGTGKTMVGQCMASYLGCNFKYQAASAFQSAYVGETERKIRKLFNTGRTYEPVVIFLDEIDSIGRTRSFFAPHKGSALTQLLSELDGIVDNKGVYIVAATNRKEDLDSALLSRVSYDFKMGLPDTHQRMDILKGLLHELPTDQIDYEYLARITPKWSQRSLAWLKSELINKLALAEVSTITTGVVEDLIEQRPAESSSQVEAIRRAI